MGKEYLIIYEVTGIQNYIFKTNKMKEITGASIIVRDKLKDLLCDILKDKGLTKESFKKWQKADEFDFIEDKGINCEVVYEGGGNLVLAYRTEAEDKEGQEKEIKKFNRILQMRFFKETYSLSLAYAYKYKGDYFGTDLNKLKKKLNKVKQSIVPLFVTPANPLTRIDQVTSQVISVDDNVHNKKVDERFKDTTMESRLKLKAAESQEDPILDSIIAFIHIDGNNISNEIYNYCKDIKFTEKESYVEAILESRKISNEINSTYNIGNKNDSVSELEGVKFRKIISSGDDITIQCNAKDAFKLAIKIMVEIEKHKLENKFTSCAGIVFVHKKFPFYKAYEYAEACCKSAKAKAKEQGNQRLSFLDYEIISSGIINSTDNLNNKSNLYMKPYCISNTKSKNSESYFHITELIKYLDRLKNHSSISRSALKELRDKYQISKLDVVSAFDRIKFKNSEALEGIECFKSVNNNKVATLYEACSLLDLFDKSSLDYIQNLYKNEGSNDSNHNNLSNGE